MTTNSILQDLYAQILHSEEQVKERNAKFKAVNEQIAVIQAKTAELRDETKSLHGNLAIQNTKVAEQEMQLKWLKQKEKIMKAQKQGLQETKLELKNELDVVEDQREREREKFIADCEEFSSMYDLTGEGKRKRDAIKRKKLEELTKNTEKLKSETEAVQKEKAEISVLENKKQVLLNTIKELELKHEEADKTIQAEKDETERLRQEKQDLSEKHKNDPELQELTAELKKCKEESISLEGVNDAMDHELIELRQQYYQMQLRKQREHREQQRQQQLEQHKQQQQPRREPPKHLRRLQHSSQMMATTMPKDSSIPGHKSVYLTQKTQDKRIQRPLFNEGKKQDEPHGTAPSSASTTPITERGKGFGKKSRFYY